MYIYIYAIYTHIYAYIYISYIYNIHFDITMMIKYVRCLDDQDIHLIYFGFSDPHGDPLWDDNPHFFWFMNMGFFFTSNMVRLLLLDMGILPAQND